MEIHRSYFVPRVDTVIWSWHMSEWLNSRWKEGSSETKSFAFPQSFVWLWSNEGQLPAQPRPQLLLRWYPPCHKRFWRRVVAGKAGHATWREWADRCHSKQEKVHFPSVLYCADITLLPLMPSLDLYLCFSFFLRVEKKERARLKTVKFHARTGMIESNRVSVEGPAAPCPGARKAVFRAAARLPGRWPTSPQVWERDQHLLSEAGTKSAHITV